MYKFLYIYIFDFILKKKTFLYKNKFKLNKNMNNY